MHVLVAVKSLELAKSRLAAHLDARARSGLVLAMLTDTVSAALSVDVVEAVTVVTPDPAVARAATQAGALVLAEPALPALPGTGRTHHLAATPEQGLNDAVRAAERHVRRTGYPGGVVALQADLPALHAHELRDALGSAPRGRSCVVDRHGTGTSALLASGAEFALHPCFGPHSAARHLASGARALDGDWPGLRTDIDTVDDLRAAADVGLGVATAAIAAEIPCLVGGAG
ncbi:2-phospho-L-lactate guanylyltransferase [Rhodococcus sp. HNM0569]|uniref:2-phospho-L-lactate guanylyltransferase n=1 Tax=Rhodococcus sp. HNM0569 TaxID=2716340 RepID=UPI00146C650E|nr:2-phospho-L-lactate guanylyltransferase [Rhodococcus sp. HNM0569]